MILECVRMFLDDFWTFFTGQIIVWMQSSSPSHGFEGSEFLKTKCQFNSMSKCLISHGYQGYYVLWRQGDSNSWDGEESTIFQLNFKHQRPTKEGRCRGFKPQIGGLGTVHVDGSTAVGCFFCGKPSQM